MSAQLRSSHSSAETNWEPGVAMGIEPVDRLDCNSISRAMLDSAVAHVRWLRAGTCAESSHHVAGTTGIA